MTVGVILLTVSVAGVQVLAAALALYIRLLYKKCSVSPVRRPSYDPCGGQRTRVACLSFPVYRLRVGFGSRRVSVGNRFSSNGDNLYLPFDKR